MGLDSVELVWRVEKDFGIKISDPEAASILTVGDFYTVLLRKLGTSPADPSATQIWSRLRDTIADQTGVKEELILPDARIVRDLGIN
jgi:acyl carrier protein